MYELQWQRAVHVTCDTVSLRLRNAHQQVTNQEHMLHHMTCQNLAYPIQAFKSICLHSLAQYISHPCIPQLGTISALRLHQTHALSLATGISYAPWWELSYPRPVCLVNNLAAVTLSAKLLRCKFNARQQAQVL